MRISRIAALTLIIAGCGQHERPPESQDQPAEQPEQAQPPDTVSQDPGLQGAQRPDYGLGAAWPPAVPDESGLRLQNQVVVKFRDGLTEERELALVDSIAKSIQAAALRNKFLEFTHYSFRWAPEAQIDRDSLISRLKTLSDVDDAWPETLTRAP
ncbi:MAG: hypothetical protein GTN75_15540 [Gemmatimonadetes bacterium]|nr:hypothetical protein [Gemmatimonadota bacterium]